jgi:xylose isomerase
MRTWKFAVNSVFFGRRRDRFTEYQPDRTLEQKFRMAASIPGISGIELKYPLDLQDVPLAKRLLEETGLECPAVNVDIKDAGHFRHGALSARKPEARQQAVSYLREGMDIAAELGAGIVTTCPLADGYDYPFQLDYTEAWGNFIESLRLAASHRPGIRIALESQPHEPHAKILLANVGMVLHVCTEAGMPNLGANLDIGHSFAAGESPAESASLLAAKGRLFYCHVNDNPGDGGDWDMISGSVHFWSWLELLYTLDRIGYDGWLGGEVAPKHIGPDAAYVINTLMVQRMRLLVERLGTDRIAALVRQEGGVGRTFEYLSRCLLQDPAEPLPPQGTPAATLPGKP